MAIVGGLDVHRRQITFDWLDSESGEVRRGRIPGDRLGFRAWLDQLEQRPADFAVEGCTGWRFVVEELERAGMGAHLAEPADTQALRGPKRHAKTDGIDARHLRDLLRAGTLPESWIPPTHIQEMRARVRLYKELIELRTAWVQRIHAVRYHQGLPTLSPSAARVAGATWMGRRLSVPPGATGSQPPCACSTMWTASLPSCERCSPASLANSQAVGRSARNMASAQ